MACPSLAVALMLLGTTHCNALLGIDDATCGGGCAADAGSGATSEEAAADRLPALNAADGGAPRGTSTPASLEGPLPRPGETPPASEPAPATEPPRSGGSAPPELVDIITAACAEEPAGEPFCVINHRVICSQGGTPDIVTVCADAEQCLRGAGPDCGPARCSFADPSLCGGAVCAPDGERCQGSTLLRCNADGTGFDVVQQCASAALCAPGTGACTPPACASSERRCEGAELQVCNADRTGFVREQSCANESSCDPRAGCAAPVCTPDRLRCSGNTLEACNPAGTAFLVLGQCPNGATCSPEQGCVVAGECAPNETRCRGRDLQRCNESQTGFVTLQECRSGSRCDAAAGRCLD